MRNVGRKSIPASAVSNDTLGPVLRPENLSQQSGKSNRACRRTRGRKPFLRIGRRSHLLFLRQRFFAARVRRVALRTSFDGVSVVSVPRRCQRVITGEDGPDGDRGQHRGVPQGEEVEEELLAEVVLFEVSEVLFDEFQAERGDGLVGDDDVRVDESVPGLHEEFFLGGDVVKFIQEPFRQLVAPLLVPFVVAIQIPLVAPVGNESFGMKILADGNVVGGVGVGGRARGGPAEGGNDDPGPPFPAGGVSEGVGARRGDVRGQSLERLAAHEDIELRIFIFPGPV
mmetsp:Transcript_28590/g.65358  ORF Transcript_28590/g.65358 Transcript_28590/m.65358 type:complete len:284 (+) Transcript_28590:337-1188(+)